MELLHPLPQKHFPPAVSSPDDMFHGPSAHAHPQEKHFASKELLKLPDKALLKAPHRVPPPDTPPSQWPAANCHDLPQEYFQAPHQNAECSPDHPQSIPQAIPYFLRRCSLSPQLSTRVKNSKSLKDKAHIYWRYRFSYLPKIKDIFTKNQLLIFSSHTAIKLSGK